MAATVYEREICHGETKRATGAWYSGAKDGTEIGSVICTRNNPMSVSPINGNHGNTRGKERKF